jgi:hypothetical protein
MVSDDKQIVELLVFFEKKVDLPAQKGPIVIGKTRA